MSEHRDLAGALSACVFFYGKSARLACADERVKEVEFASYRLTEFWVENPRLPRELLVNNNAILGLRFELFLFPYRSFADFDGGFDRSALGEENRRIVLTVACLRKRRHPHALPRSRPRPIATTGDGEY